METLKIGMKHTQEWTVEERYTTQRGDYRVFSTPSMTQLVESTANQLAAPHLKQGQGQVGVVVTVRHMGKSGASDRHTATRASVRRAATAGTNHEVWRGSKT